MAIKSILRPFIVQLRTSRNYLFSKMSRQPSPPITRQPAFDPETEKWFLNRIGSVKSYLEYGAGASTLLVSDASIPTISIESDHNYADAVRAALPKGHRTKIVAANIGRTGHWGYPLWTFKTKGALRRWQTYPEAGAHELANCMTFPDLALIDGRFRIACCLTVVKAAIEHNRETQILFDDYALRPQYAVVEQVLGVPESIGRARVFNINPARISLKTVKTLLDAAYADFS